MTKKIGAAELRPDVDSDRLVSITEAARQIGKHPNTLRFWIKTGLLKAVRLPSGLLNLRQSQVDSLCRLQEAH